MSDESVFGYILPPRVETEPEGGGYLMKVCLVMFSPGVETEPGRTWVLDERKSIQLHAFPLGQK